MARMDVSKILFYAMTTGTILGATYVAGLKAGEHKTPTYLLWSNLEKRVTESIRLVVGEVPTLTGTRPTHFLQPSRYEGAGVTINSPENDQTDLLLISGFFKDTNELQLIHRDGSVVARWPVSYHKLVPDPDFIPRGLAPATDWNIGIHGALAMPDGSVVFNFDYGGTVRLDRCNNVEWVIHRQTHHSVQRAEKGGFWVAGRRSVLDPESPYPPFETPFQEDTVMRISDDGKILSEFSAVKLFYDNNLQSILTATGSHFVTGMDWDHEVVHLNKVGELPSALAADFPMFEAGDLVLSIRELNMILVVDPTGSKVRWWKIGPWLRQHDPQFIPGGRILLFNNNVFNLFGDTEPRTPVTMHRVSQVMAVDPATGHSEVLFGGVPGENLLSVVRGKVAQTPRGGLLITEADDGRVLETNAARQVIWEYINRYSEKELAELTQARLYPVKYFDFDTRDWSCPAR
jgi:Arylsulfotransferase (ASST)